MSVVQPFDDATPLAIKIEALKAEGSYIPAEVIEDSNLLLFGENSQYVPNTDISDPIDITAEISADIPSLKIGKGPIDVILYSGGDKMAITVATAVFENKESMMQFLQPNMYIYKALKRADKYAVRFFADPHLSSDLLKRPLILKPGDKLITDNIE